MKVKYDDKEIEIIGSNIEISLDECERVKVATNNGQEERVYEAPSSINVERHPETVPLEKAEEILEKVDVVFDYFRQCCESFSTIASNDPFNEWISQIYIGKCNDEAQTKCSVCLKQYTKSHSTTAPKCLCNGPEIIFDKNDSVAKYFISLVVRYALQKKYYKTVKVYAYYDGEIQESIYDPKFIKNVGKRKVKRQVLSYDSLNFTGSVVSLVNYADRHKTLDILINLLRKDVLKDIQNGEISYEKASEYAQEMETLSLKLAFLAKNPPVMAKQ